MLSFGALYSLTILINIGYSLMLNYFAFMIQLFAYLLPLIISFYGASKINLLLQKAITNGILRPVAA